MQDDQGHESATQHQQWEPDMAPVKRPVWPLVLGWICIALSSFGLLCGGIGMLMLPFSAKMVEGMLEGDPPPPSMTPSVVTIVLGPAVEQWAQDYPSNQMAQGMNNPGQEIGEMIGLGLFLLLGLAWPLFLLLWFGLYKTKAHHITGILGDEYLDDEYINS